MACNVLPLCRAGVVAGVAARLLHHRFWRDAAEKEAIRQNLQPQQHSLEIKVVLLGEFPEVNPDYLVAGELRVLCPDFALGPSKKTNPVVAVLRVLATTLVAGADDLETGDYDVLLC